MTTPTNLPSSFVAGAILTAAQQNDLRGAFRVLQLKFDDANVEVTSASATYVDVGLSVSITPQATTNKILLISSIAMRASGGAADVQARFMRDATSIFGGVQGFFQSGDGSTISMMYLDSPVSTSAITYKVQGSRNFGAGSAVFQSGGSVTSSLIVCEISA
jgi:hypothetical protein